MVKEVLGEHGVIVVAQPLSRVSMLSEIPYSSMMPLPASAHEVTLNVDHTLVKTVESQLRSRAERTGRGSQQLASSLQQQALPDESSQKLRCLHRMIFVQPNLSEEALVLAAASTGPAFRTVAARLSLDARSGKPGSSPVAAQ